jgi:hypothetical protein
MEIKEMMERFNSLSDMEKGKIRYLLRNESVEQLKDVLGDELEEKITLLKNELEI